MSRFFNVDQINDILASVKTYIDGKARIFTGSGTTNHLAKFTDTNKLGDGPALGNSTTTFLRNDGQWATPSGGGSGTVTSITINANSPISVNDSSAITTNGTRTLSHATSGATAGSYGDSSDQTPSYGSTFKVPYVKVNNTGHVTEISEHTVKIPASDNTDTHRPIKMNGTQILGNNTTALDLVAGSNITLTNNSGAVTIEASGGSIETGSNTNGSWIKLGNIYIQYADVIIGTGTASYNFPKAFSSAPKALVSWSVPQINQAGTRLTVVGTTTTSISILGDGSGSRTVTYIAIGPA